MNIEFSLLLAVNFVELFCAISELWTQEDIPKAVRKYIMCFIFKNLHKSKKKPL